ncbi:MAG TPA: SDR family NAD(P)-dependent oxidoreductase [Bacillales bacterium]|nr:SDR family NAD(P)-dependent oxidoreductase [Bacillales bacterium]
MEISGKTALITGSSRGIGKGIALAMAANGYNIGLCHWNDHENAEQVARVIREKYSRKCTVFHMNLEEEKTPVKLVEDAVRALGDIHTVVNNAGVTVFSELMNMKTEEINQLADLDFRAPILIMKAAGKHMMERKIKGNMINITSTRGERAYLGDAVYGGVKAALTRATETIALEFSTYGIRVNCIAPGAIQTSQEREDYYEAFGRKIPLSRAGTPEDIAKAVVWLSSEQASYVTGTTIRVDGGLILPGMPETEDKQTGWKGG